MPVLTESTFELAHYGQPEMTARIDIAQDETGWSVRWHPVGLDRDMHACTRFYDRTQTSATPNVFDVFRDLRDTLQDGAEISGNRSGGTATNLTKHAARAVAGAAHTTYADALSSPLGPVMVGPLLLAGDAASA